jgi:rhodanese-related sulfurtransferase
MVNKNLSNRAAMSELEINVERLKQMMHDGEVQLIDIREDSEWNLGNRGNRHVPFSKLKENMDLIKKTDTPTVLYCQRGNRSKVAAEKLRQYHQCSNIYSLVGGIEAFI